MYSQSIHIADTAVLWLLTCFANIARFTLLYLSLRAKRSVTISVADLETIKRLAAIRTRSFL